MTGPTLCATQGYERSQKRAFVSPRRCGFRVEHVIDFTGVIHLGFMEYGAILPAKYGK